MSIAGSPVLLDGLTAKGSHDLALVDRASTIVYTPEVEDTYRFDEHSYDVLRAAGVAWQTAVQILRTHPVLRSHTGTILHLAAQAADGHCYAITLAEEASDSYLIVDGRRLDDAEAATVRTLLQGGIQ